MDLTVSNPSQFIFPVLKNSEILQCMSELGVELTKPELLEPHRHKERVHKVFLQLLDICCGLTEDDFALRNSISPSNKAVESLAHPELHEESFSDLKFFKCVRKAMETCGLYDFGWKDLQAPTAKRFRWQLSAAINMAKFREDQLKLYSELNESRTELLLGLEEVNEENAQLNKQLEATQIDSNFKSQEIMEVLQECAELETEIARNNKLQAARREEATVLKKKANDLKDDIASAELALEEANAEEQSLAPRVVSSPERRKHNLYHKRDLLEQVRKECAAVEENLVLTKTKISNVTQAKEDVQRPAALAEEVQVEVQKHAQISEQVRVVAGNVEANKKQSAQILDQKEECDRTLHRTEEKIVHLRKQGKIKMDAAQEALEMAKIQLLEVEKDRREGMQRVEAGEAEVRAMEAKIEEETKRTNKEIADMIAEYSETEKIVLEQDAKFMAAIGVV